MTAAPIPAGSGIPSAHYVCSGLFNADALVDFVAVGGFSAAAGLPAQVFIQTQLYLSNGKELTPPPPSALYMGIACGDVNGDALDDVALITKTHTYIHVSSGAAPNPFAAAPLVVDSHGGSLINNRVRLVDLLGADARLDVVVAYSTGVLVIENTSSGPGAPSFAPAVTLGSAFPGPESNVAVADMDGAVGPDVVLVSGNDIVMMANLGGDTFDAPVSILHSSVVFNEINNVEVAPLRLGALPDVIFASREGVAILKNWDGSPAAFEYQLLLGGFVPGSRTALEVGLLLGAEPDILVADFFSDSILSIPNIGNYSFGPVGIISDQAFTVSDLELAPIFVTPPGAPPRASPNDIVFTSPSRASLDWVYGYVFDPFSTTNIASPIIETLALHAQDVDNDGDVDVLFSWLLGTESVANLAPGSFAARVPAVPGSTAFVMTTGSDLDLDGLVDLVGLSFDGALVWAFNSGSLVPYPDSRSSRFPLFFGFGVPRGAITVDITGDGWLDIILISSNGVTGFVNQRSADPMFVSWKSVSLSSHPECQDIKAVRVSPAASTLIAVCPSLSPAQSVVLTLDVQHQPVPVVNEFVVTAPFSSAQSLAFVDADLDGELEIIMMSNDTLAIYDHDHSAPPGSLVFNWTAPYQVLGGFLPASPSARLSVTIVNFNIDLVSDPYPDVVPTLLLSGSSGVTSYAVWLKNLGTTLPNGERFKVEFLAPSLALPRGLVLSDLSGDGYPDSIFASQSSVSALYSLEPLIKSTGAPVKTQHVNVQSCGFTVNCILQAIAQAAVCAGDTVAVPPGTYTGCPRAGPYVLNKAIILQGMGTSPHDTVVDCQGNGAFLYISSEFPDPPLRVTVANLKVTGTRSVPQSPIGSVGIHVAGPYTTLVARDVVFANCSSSVALGSVTQLDQGLGGALLVSGGASFEATRVSFVGNTAGVSGGGLAVKGTQFSLVLNDVSFLDNVAPSMGGALYVETLGAATSAMTATNLTVRGNLAVTGSGGGAAFVAPGNARLDGQLVGLAFANNAAPNGAAGAVLVSGRAAVVTVVDALFSDHSARFGAAFALVHDLSVVPSSGSETSALSLGLASPTLDADPSNGGVLDLSQVATLDLNAARYGALALVCGGNLSLAMAPSVIAKGTAELAGGAAFACLLPGSVSWSVNTAPPWFSLSSTSLIDVNANGWGSLYATPGKVLEWDDPTVSAASTSESEPLAVVTGVPVEIGARARLLDTYGVPVVDDLQVIALVKFNNAPVLLEGNDVRAVLSFGTAAFDGTIFTLTDAAQVGTVLSLGLVPETAGLSSPVTPLPLWVSVTACPPGFGTLVAADAFRCSQCSQGTFSETTDSLSPCLPCPDGGFSDFVEGATSCLFCPANTVRDGSGSNATSASGTAVPPCVCLPGFYSPNATMDTPCVSCPSGAVCKGQLMPPFAAPGYFPSPTSQGVFLECSVPSSCRGGLPFACAEGYTGRLCSACADNYYALGDRCFRCDKARTAILVTVFLVGTVLVLAALLAFNLRTTLSYRFAAVMIGLNSLQVSAMYGRLALPWGDWARTWFQVISVLNLNLDLTSPECSAPNIDVWLLKWWLIILLPVFFAAGLALLAVGLVLVSRGFPAVKLTIPAVVDATRRAHFQSLVLIYLPLVATALSVFGCRREADRSWSLAVEPSRKCFTSTYWTQFPFALIAGLLYTFGIPLGLIVLLRKLSDSLSVMDLHIRYGFLVARFLDSSSTWEAVIMGRKAGVVLATTLFFSDEAKANAALLVLLGSFAHLLVVRPYRSPFHNTIAVAALGSCLLILQAGTIRSSLLRAVFVGLGIVINSLVITGGTALDLYLTWARESIAAMDFFTMVAVTQENIGAHDVEQRFAGGDVALTVDTPAGQVKPSEVELSTFDLSSSPALSTVDVDPALSSVVATPP